MKTLAGSIFEQLMLDKGLASVSNPTTYITSSALNANGLASLPAIQLWSYNE